MGELKEVSIEITNKCSLKCIHCSSDAGKEFNDELSLDEIINIINQAKSLGGEVLTLSGGEPILSEDLFDIIRYARGKNFEIRLQTSGVYCFENKFISIPQSHLKLFSENMNPNDKMVYAVLGLQKTHDHMTSVNGSYRQVMESIRKSKEEGINVEVHTVPNRFNYRELSSLADILENKKVDSWHLLRLVLQGRGAKHSELELDQEQFQELQESISILSKKNFKMKIRLGHNIDRRYLSDSSYSAVRCRIGEKKILIRANGDATYCAAMKYNNFGNIRENKLAYFWKEHPFVKEVRLFLNSDFKEITGKCSSCEILNDCRGGCVAQRLYKYNELKRGPDPLCYRKQTKN